MQIKADFTKQRGFSLLEILIAFSILALSLSILLKIFSGGVNTAMIAEDYTAAVQIAEGLLAKTGVETPLQSGNTTGSEGEKYQWQITISPFDFNPEAMDTKTITAVFFKINVTVSWMEGDDNERQVALTTLKLVNKTL